MAPATGAEGSARRPGPTGWPSRPARRGRAGALTAEGAALPVGPERVAAGGRRTVAARGPEQSRADPGLHLQAGGRLSAQGEARGSPVPAPPPRAEPSPRGRPHLGVAADAARRGGAGLGAHAQRARPVKAQAAGAGRQKASQVLVARELLRGRVTAEPQAEEATAAERSGRVSRPRGRGRLGRSPSPAPHGPSPGPEPRRCPHAGRGRPGRGPPGRRSPAGRPRHRGGRARARRPARRGRAPRPPSATGAGRATRSGRGRGSARGRLHEGTRVPKVRGGHALRADPAPVRPRPPGRPSDHALCSGPAPDTPQPGPAPNWDDPSGQRPLPGPAPRCRCSRGLTGAAVRVHAGVRGTESCPRGQDELPVQGQELQEAPLRKDTWRPRLQRTLVGAHPAPCPRPRSGGRGRPGGSPPRLSRRPRGSRAAGPGAQLP